MNKVVVTQSPDLSEKEASTVVEILEAPPPSAVDDDWETVVGLRAQK